MEIISKIKNIPKRVYRKYESEKYKKGRYRQIINKTNR